MAPLKDMSLCIHGASLTCPAFQQLLWACLRALLERLGVQCFNMAIAGDLMVGRLSAASGSSQHGVVARSAPAVGMLTREALVPVCIKLAADSIVRCRIVSRGRATAVASDWGALEVFAGASIGATDPFTVVAAVDAQLKQL